MNNAMGHCTEEQLFRLIDNDTTAPDRSEIAAHLEVCSRCRAEFESLVRFGNALRRLPLSPASPLFTRTVLLAAGLKPGETSTTRFLEYAAGALGLLVLMTFTVAGLALTGGITAVWGHDTKNPGTAVLGSIGFAVSQVSNDMGRILKEFFPFLFGGTTLWVSFGALAVVLSLALLDRAFGKTFAEKGR
jgi:anti-sigma factor RsiW